MKKILFCLMTLLFSGCALTTVSKPLDRVPLNLANPPKLALKPVKFLVIHKDNAEAVFKELEKQGLEPVVFALTGDDYKALATNVQDIKQHIILQRKIIILYKDYYEGK